MLDWLDTLLILLVLTNIFLFGSSRFSACIKTVALQGVLLGLLLLASHPGRVTGHLLMLAGASAALKSGIFPWLLNLSMRRAGVRREIEPFVGYIPSILAGLLLLGISFWIAGRLPLPAEAHSPLLLPVALFTMLSGLLMLIARRKALTQALGYLVLENGIFIFGATLVESQPMLFEMGVLLDVFFAVFVFGIAIFHISVEFNHLDTDRLASLKD